MPHSRYVVRDEVWLRTPGRRLCAVGVLALATLTVAVPAAASAGGRSGFSGNPHTNAGASCDVCHAPDADGASTATVGIYGPDSMDAGSTRSLFIWMTGGPAQSAGVGIASAGKVGLLQPADADLRLLNDELVHAAPKAFDANGAVFVFQYTAPNYDTDVTLYAAANSASGDLDLLGDAIATAAHGITVVNGFEAPPEPPQAVLGELSATLFATGLSSPVAIENAGDERLFVVERAGYIRVVREDGNVLPTPFLDIHSRVDDGASEMGLLGLAFHPDYANNGYFYVYYTYDPGPGADRSRVSRFSVTSDADVAEPASELVLLEFAQPYANHNGGDLHFGPAGYLHIASGDGGSGGDPQGNGQSTATLLGKMLRIDVDNAPGNGPDCDISGMTANYTIPAGNAFTDGPGGAGCDEIFALGVRNPWRFSFDAETGAMWIADVGQYNYEEVNYLPPGSAGGINLGWRCYEGTAPYNASACNRVYLPPVHTYSHAASGCSITGGRVYRGAAEPLLHGHYFFTDFCQSSIRSLSGAPGQLVHRVVLPQGELSSVSTFGEDSDGEMYVGELYTGRIYRLDPEVPPGC